VRLSLQEIETNNSEEWSTMILSEIIAPLVNTNEPEAHLVHIHVKDGQFVEKGSILFTIETTKSTLEIESPEKGFVWLLGNLGDTIKVGDKLAMITDNEQEPDKAKKKSGESRKEKVDGELKLRITKPARTLATSLGLNLTLLPVDKLITEKDILLFTQKKKKIMLEIHPSEKPYLLVYGAGGHAKSLIEMVEQSAIYKIVGIVDDNEKLTGKKVLGFPVLGTPVLLPELIKQGVKFAANGVGGITDIQVRGKIFTLLEKLGYIFPALTNLQATIEPSARIENGVQVFANAYIGAEAFLHENCLVNTNAVVSHDCEIGSFSHIAPGALLAGEVFVGKNTLVGMGVTTNIGVRIGNDVRIGNGAIVLADVPDKMVIQAGRYWAGRPD
jgi:sugar O-acyltransferase (sialic acid O-acetyltransferase NeuD family)